MNAPATGTRLEWSEIYERLKRANASLSKASALSPGQKEHILRQRAERLAQEPDKAVANVFVSYPVFRLGGQDFALEGACVREILRLKNVTRLPTVPSFVAGVINLRGQILSLIDLTPFLAPSQPSETESGYVIVMHSAEMEFGILADEIKEIRALSADEVGTLPPHFGGRSREYLQGITRDGLAVLDGARILADEALLVNEEVSG